MAVFQISGPLAEDVPVYEVRIEGDTVYVKLTWSNRPSTLKMVLWPFRANRPSCRPEGRAHHS